MLTSLSLKISDTRTCLTPFGCVAILSCHKETKKKLCKGENYVGIPYMSFLQGKNSGYSGQS